MLNNLYATFFVISFIKEYFTEQCISILISVGFEVRNHNFIWYIISYYISKLWVWRNKRRKKLLRARQKWWNFSHEETSRVISKSKKRKNLRPREFLLADRYGGRCFQRRKFKWQQWIGNWRHNKIYPIVNRLKPKRNFKSTSAEEK